ncbi:hydroxyacylglutathione hydrolase [Roseovarius sp. SCSIO 43702]|uniref:hydroxyacylglutathione hydrolase n=1 Tax=Roseovarius sp. SCSIO 43702 TaxID=2823043 RepID=UPI001C72B8BB|nr:hydroxyacylglutathione hydrolase [Roseovarius sp. SCSIO 43702]QYX57698.1 hydroxyacylglutathione hydrolase [Roseovarius sp. SCSIO 43702]
MTLDIMTIPCLSDNYAYLAHDPETGDTALVDAPEAAPILRALDESGWRLSHVLITHHHADHVQGIADILARHPATVVGARADAHRLPPLDIAVAEGDTVTIGRETGHVLDVSGHTVGHIAFHFPDSRAAFTADSLMALGCGRVFEGTMEQMWHSLSKLAALPEDTRIYSGHEYTAANARFALSIDPKNSALISRARAVDAARTDNQPTVPSLLSEELATNPFLRASDPALKSELGMSRASDAETFAEIRTRKDNF